MNKSVLRAALLSSASLAVSAILLPSVASAATVCTGVNDFPNSKVDITCVENGTTVVATGTTEISTNVLAPAQGLSAISAVDMTVNLAPASPTDNTILTNLISTPGIILNATGDLVLNAPDLTIVTRMPISDAVNLTGATVTATLGTLDVRDASGDGLEVTSAGAIDIDIGGFVRSTDRGITIHGGAGQIDLTTANVSGFVQHGITVTGTGTINVDAGDVFGGLRGIEILGGAGPIDLQVGTVRASDFSNQFGIHISGTGLITVNSSTITVGGEDSGRGVWIQGGAGAISVSTGAVSTSGLDGDGFLITSTGQIDLNVGGSVTTTGDLSEGIFVQSPGQITVNGSTVSTSGLGSAGVFVNSLAGSGTRSITLTGVSTSGNDADGVFVNAQGGGIVDIDIDTIDTTGNNSHGVEIDTGANAVTIDVDGAITTTGTGSIGAKINGGSGAIDLTTDNVTTAAATGVSIVATTGPVTLSAGNISAAGLGNRGLEVTTDGAMDLATGSIAVTGTESTGVFLTGGPGAIELNTGTVNVTGLEAFGVSISGDGPITSTTGAINVSGGGNVGLFINGGPGLVSANYGNITVGGSTSDALSISSQGNIVLNGTGTLTTSGANGRGAIISTDGNVTGTVGNISAPGATSSGLTVNAGGLVNLAIGSVSATGDAIVATSTGGGAVTLGLNGNVTAGGTAVTVSSDGAKIINVATGTTVTGPAIVIQGGGLGLLTVNNRGTIGSATSGFALSSDVNEPIAINNLAGGVINGAFDLGNFNDTIVNSGTLNFRDNTGFYAGSDSITNNAGGVINTANGTIIRSLETFSNAGTMNVSGTLTFMSVAPAFTNAGTFNLGSGAAVTGLATFANNGMLAATGGTASLATTGGLTNAGTITMVDGAANDTLAISGNYSGSGSGRLAFDVVGTAAGNTADLLTIGGNISGTTAIAPNFVNPVIDPDGVLIVDGGGTLGPNAFVIGTGTNQGLIQYSLLVQGNNVLLASTADASVFDLGVLGSMSQDIWYQSADAYLACAAARRGDFGRTRSSPIELCAQLYGGSDRYGDGETTATVFGTSLTFNDRLKTNRRGAQVDIGFAAGGNFHVGLTGGYEHARSSLTTATDVDVEGYAIGAYAQYGSELGLYAGVMVKRDDYEAQISNPVTITATEVDGDSFGIDGEAGWRMNGLGALVDLNAGLSYVKSDLDDFTAGNIAVGGGSATSLRGRLGARLGWSASPGPYVGATLFHEFKGDDDMTVGSGTLVSSIDRRSRGTWARLETGIGAGARSGPLLSAWVDLGDVKGWGVRGGFRF